MARKLKQTHLRTVHCKLKYDAEHDMTKVDFTEGYFAQEKLLGSVWIPGDLVSTKLILDKKANTKSLIESRLKHDFGITVDHMSWST